MKTFQTKPYMLNHQEGEFIGVLGATVHIKATSEQTGGVFNLFEALCPPNFMTPLHIHYVEDVIIYVLDGQLTFFWGSEQQDAAAGSYFYQPRGTPHGFRVEGETSARILYMTVPAGLDRFLSEHQLLAPEVEIERHAAQYKIEILEPLPRS